MPDRAGQDTGCVSGHVAPAGRGMLTVPAAAQRAGVSVKTIRRAYLAGELMCHQPIERELVLSDLRVNVQVDLSARRRQLLACAGRDADHVTDATDVDDHEVSSRTSHDPTQMSDHEFSARAGRTALVKRRLRA